MRFKRIFRYTERQLQLREKKRGGCKEMGDGWKKKGRQVIEHR